MTERPFPYPPVEMPPAGWLPQSWAYRNMLGQDREHSPTRLVRNVSTDTNISPLDDVITATSSITLTLETAVGADGRKHWIYNANADASVITISTQAGESVDGTTTVSTNTPYASLKVASNGTKWIGATKASSGIFSSVSTSTLFIAAGQVYASTYTPTLSSIANLDGSTTYASRFWRLGNQVSVSGRVDVNPTLTATQTTLGITLPVASAFANANDCYGVAACNSIAGMSAAIYAEPTNDQAQMQWVATDINSNAMFYTFMYPIL